MREIFTPALARAAGRVVFTLYVVAAVFVVGRDVNNRVGARGTSVTSPTAAAKTAPPTTLPTAPSPAATTAAATPSITVTATPAPSAQPTPAPLVVTAYQNGGRRLAALEAPVGYTFTAPLAGTVRVAVYQFLEGEVRIGSNIPSQPFFPYITITSADHRMILRPGALDRDVQLIVKDGQVVAEGSPLFTIFGEGASSWKTFYDGNVTAQVVASVAAWPSGAELDPVPVFKRP
jgi:hypothetical protein